MVQYAYPRPALTVDILLISIQSPQRVLLIQRLNDPFKNKWALPGGFVEENEELVIAAHRELKEETNLSIANLQQFKTIGTPFRDPRGHTVSVIYWAEVDADNAIPTAADDAANAKWYDIQNLPPLAFDHHQIIADFSTYYVKKLKTNKYE
jgi:8-oxo-dGTP diphosphatase